MGFMQLVFVQYTRIFPVAPPFFNFLACFGSMLAANSIPRFRKFLSDAWLFPMFDKVVDLVENRFEIPLIF